MTRLLVVSLLLVLSAISASAQVPGVAPGPGAAATEPVALATAGQCVILVPCPYGSCVWLRACPPQVAALPPPQAAQLPAPAPPPQATPLPAPAAPLVIQLQDAREARDPQTPARPCTCNCPRPAPKR